jgi:RNA polymerase sigma-70 factor (ECF subfamily)
MDSAAEVAGPDGAGRAAVADAETAISRRIAAGDVAAWEAFFEQYSPWAYRFAYCHLDGNRADAEDLCSDILLTAARSIGRFDSKRGTLDVWLLGLARNRLARFCRRRRRRVPFVAHPEGRDGAVPDPDPVADSAVERDLVNRALASLPQRQAAVLVGKYVSGHTVQEMAQSMDSTPKAIESLLSRARAAFRCAFSALLKDGSGGESRE